MSINANSLTAKTSPGDNDNLLLFDNSTNNGTKIDYDALADAVLGAARLGDIGKLFPDTDPAYEGADSLKLLQEVATLVRQKGFEILDVDCTVAAQAPKLSPYRDEMRKNLARALDVDVEQVGVKATTTEGLGFIGRKEGVAAWAVALLSK